MTVQLQPTGDKIVVKREETQTKSAGGILIPDSAQDKPMEATVVAIGRGQYVNGNLIVPEVKPGYKVLLAKWSGVEFQVDGESFLLVKESDILGFFVTDTKLKAVK